MTRARILADYVAGGTTAAEFDYLDGVTSNVQTQMDAKAPLASPTFTGTSNLSSGVTMPAGHVVQTVNASFAGTLTSDTSEDTTITALHLTKDIQITAGNSVKFTIQFPYRISAGDGRDYVHLEWWIYHKVDGGSFAECLGDWIGTFYHDASGNLTSWWNMDMDECLIGIHTPSSGTHHHYKLYYKMTKGLGIYIGVDTGYAKQFVILEEIET